MVFVCECINKFLFLHNRKEAYYPMGLIGYNEKIIPKKKVKFIGSK